MINPATNLVVATITVGHIPTGVVVSPTGPYADDVYATNPDLNTVSVIS